MNVLLHTLPEINIASAARFAARLAICVTAGDIITLRGEVGSGKTTFAQHFIAALSPEPVEVTSPTFTLMQSYPCLLSSGKPETIWHLDLYRLEEAEEARALGLEELEQHVMLIEWPEVIEHLLPQNRLDIHFAHSAEDRRDIHCYGNEAWRKRLKDLW